MFTHKRKKLNWCFEQHMKTNLQWIKGICWELPYLVSEAVNPPWLRLSERPYDHKPLRRQSLSPWQGHHPCPLYFTLLGPKPDQLANDG